MYVIAWQAACGPFSLAAREVAKEKEQKQRSESAPSVLLLQVEKEKRRGKKGYKRLLHMILATVVVTTDGCLSMISFRVFLVECAIV